MALLNKIYVFDINFLSNLKILLDKNKIENYHCKYCSSISNFDVRPSLIGYLLWISFDY